MFEIVDSDVLRSWVRTAVVALGEARAEIDALNVFPVPDGDTGTNMYLTIEAAETAMIEADAALAEATPETERMLVMSTALTKGAMLGARGNSGVILSQIMRGMVMVPPVDDEGARPAADVFRAGLLRASELAYSAVGSPKEGTILTVVRRAAEAAAAAPPHGNLAQMVTIAADAADIALDQTTEQLEPLRLAGVVDSGGRGFVVILSALVEVITGRRRPPPVISSRPSSPPGGSKSGGDYVGPAYEVMYLLEADDDRVPALKVTLQAMGDSLVVVGGDGLWNVHVHVDDAGAAVEAGMDTGRPYRIRITYLSTPDSHAHRVREGRRVVAVAHGGGIADLLAELDVGVVVAKPQLAPATGEVLAAVLGQDAGEVIVLPSDKDIRAAAEAAAVSAREQGLRVAVVPTRSITQSLAAIAVHDPGLAFDDDVVAMSRASGATRYGGVTVSSREVMTSAGRCRPGDILGMVDGDILQIGADFTRVALLTLELMLSAGAELVTIVRGDDAEDSLVDAVVRRMGEDHPGVEVTVYDGGQPVWPLIFGVE